MKISDMEDDKGYEMLVDGECKMIAKGSFFKSITNHPSIKAVYENGEYEYTNSIIEYKEI